MNYYNLTHSYFSNWLQLVLVHVENSVQGRDSIAIIVKLDLVVADLMRDENNLSFFF
jgi:hypothetical protein